MKYNINSLEIKRDEFDKLFEEAENFDLKTGLGKREIGKSRFLIVEDESTGTHVCFAIRNVNKKTANARFVVRAKIDEEASAAKVDFSKKGKGFELSLEDISQTAFFTDLEYHTAGNKDLEEIYDALQPKPIFGVILDEQQEENAETATQENEISAVSTFMPVVMKARKNAEASKSQFFANDEELYLIVCPDQKGELSVWLANNKIVSIDAESGKPVFARTDAGRPWERVLQENAEITSEDVKKLSRAKSREFFKKGAVATVWQEAGNKGKEKVVLTASRKEIKEFLTQARNTYKQSVEEENGTVKNIKKVFKKARYAVTGFVAGAALTAIVLAGGLTTGNIDKADAAKEFGRTQVQTATSVEVKANTVQENVIQGKLFNYVVENGNVSILDCMGLSEVAASNYEEYKSGLGYLKYGFKQNSVYSNATLQGIGEELAEQAVAELSENGVTLTESDENKETKTKVVYPVGNKTVEESFNKDNMVGFLVLNGMSEDEAKVVADAYEKSFEAAVSVTKADEIPVGPTVVENDVDFSDDEVAEAITRAIDSTKQANNDTGDWKIEYSSSEDQIIVVSTEEFLYLIDLAERDEDAVITSAPIADQDDLLERLEIARLDDKHIDFAVDANTLYGDEVLVKRVTDKFLSDNRQYTDAKAYVGGMDVQASEEGTKLKQVIFMVVEQADGKNSIFCYTPNEVVSKKASPKMDLMSAASFFAEIGAKNPNFVVNKFDVELYPMNKNDYQSPKSAVVAEENINEETPAEETTVEEQGISL